jgi:hypothetical protein
MKNPASALTFDRLIPKQALPPSRRCECPMDRNRLKAQGEALDVDEKM